MRAHFYCVGGSPSCTPSSDPGRAATSAHRVKTTPSVHQRRYSRTRPLLPSASRSTLPSKEPRGRWQCAHTPYVARRARRRARHARRKRAARAQPRSAREARRAGAFARWFLGARFGTRQRHRRARKLFSPKRIRTRVRAPLSCTATDAPHRHLRARPPFPPRRLAACRRGSLARLGLVALHLGTRPHLHHTGKPRGHARRAPVHIPLRRRALSAPRIHACETLAGAVSACVTCV